MERQPRKCKRIPFSRNPMHVRLNSKRDQGKVLPKWTKLIGYREQHAQSLVLWRWSYRHAGNQRWQMLGNAQVPRNRNEKDEVRNQESLSLPMQEIILLNKI